MRLDPTWLGLSEDDVVRESGHSIAALKRAQKAFMQSKFDKVLREVAGGWEEIAKDKKAAAGVTLVVQALHETGKEKLALDVAGKVFGSLPDELIPLQASVLKAVGEQEKAEALCADHLTLAKKTPTAATLDILETYVLQILAPAQAVQYIDSAYICFYSKDTERVKQLKEHVHEAAIPAAAPLPVTRSEKPPQDPVNISPSPPSKQQTQITEQAPSPAPAGPRKVPTVPQPVSLGTLEFYLIKYLGPNKTTHKAVTAVLAILLFLLLRRSFWWQKPAIKL